MSSSPPDAEGRAISVHDLTRLFALSLDLLCVANHQGYFLHVNPAFESVLGYTEAEMLARPFLDFVHPEDRTLTVLEAQKLAQGGQTVSFQNRYLRKDGSWCWLSWKSVPEGEVIYAAARDVTAERQAAELLREREAMRNQHLTRDAFQRGRLEMAAGILHDLGNAMTGIGARAVDLQAEVTRAATYEDTARKAADFLRPQAEALGAALGAAKGAALVRLTDTLAESLTRSRTAMGASVTKLLGYVAHAQELITTHRDYSRATGGPARVHTPVQTLLHDAYVLASDGVEKRGGTLDVRCPRPSPTVYVERGPVMQSLLNLLKNALESCDTVTGRAPRIDMVAREDGDAVVIEVRDNGAGFPSGDAGRLFEDGVSTRDRGSGLGLGSVRRMIESVGGSASLTSEGPGRGAVARVRLPGDGG